jgi:RNA polymerase sigma factor (sigma-70 family)
MNSAIDVRPGREILPEFAIVRVDSALLRRLGCPTLIDVESQTQLNVTDAPSLVRECDHRPVSVCSDDAQLVLACRRGDQRAWALLIGRYKGLIMSFARRYHANPQDAADIFQFVCSELFVSLPRLRNPQRVRAWITTVSAHAAYHWKMRHLAHLKREGEELDAEDYPLLDTQHQAVEYEERDRLIREAIAQLPPRARELVQLLFFEDPPMPYETVAARLGLSNRSIARLRGRCLKKLRRALDRGRTRN